MFEARPAGGLYYGAQHMAALRRCSAVSLLAHGGVLKRGLRKDYLLIDGQADEWCPDMVRVQGRERMSIMILAACWKSRFPGKYPLSVMLFRRPETNQQPVQ